MASTSSSYRRVSSQKDAFAIRNDALRKMGCRFRMTKRKRIRVIRILDYKPVWEGLRKHPVEFASPFRWQDEDWLTGPNEIKAIKECAQLCEESHEAGRWLGTRIDWRHHSIDVESGASGLLSWSSFAHYVMDYIDRELVREGSKKNYVGFLNKMASWSGPVMSARIEQWIEETDPTQHLGAYKNKRDLINKITQSKAMPLDDLYQRMVEQVAKVEGGHGRKRKAVDRQKPRAIPRDEDFERWLDAFPVHLAPLRTVFALIATYGLRPHEVWHLDWIRDTGIAHIRFGKTGERILTPVPFRWVQRYSLPDQLQQAQRWMRSHSKVFTRPWPKRSAEPVFHPGDRLVPLIERRNGLMDCWNSEELGEQIAVWMEMAGVPELWGETVEGRGEREDGLSRARSYDPRHAFAIRCYLSEETMTEPDQAFADWMGHSLNVHKDTYRRWIPLERQVEATEARLQRRTERLAGKTFKDSYQEKGAATEVATPSMDEATYREFLEFQKFKAFQAMQNP